LFTYVCVDPIMINALSLLCAVSGPHLLWQSLVHNCLYTYLCVTAASSP